MRYYIFGRAITECYDWLELQGRAELCHALGKKFASFALVDKIPRAAYLRKVANREGLSLWTALKEPDNRPVTVCARELAQIESALRSAVDSEEDIDYVNARSSTETALWEVNGYALNVEQARQFLEDWKNYSDNLKAALELEHLNYSKEVKAYLQSLTKDAHAAAFELVEWLNSAESKDRCVAEFKLTAKAFKDLQSLENDYRWVYIKKPELLETARKKGRICFSCLPKSEQWKKVVGFYPPAEVVAKLSLHRFKSSTLNRIVNELGIETNLKRARGGVLLPLFNLVRLFGDYNSVRRFVENKNLPWNSKGIHDAGQFSLPIGLTPEKWAGLAMRHPAALTYSTSFSKLEEKGIFPNSVNALRKEVLKLGYPKVPPGYEELAAVCLEAGVSGTVFKEYLTFWQDVKVKTAEFCPHVAVSEISAGEQWKLVKLAADDFRGPLLGLLTGCCQHLSGAGASCARHGVHSPYSGFYVVLRKGTIVAQSWAWRKGNNLIFDSIETRCATTQELEVILKLYKAAASAIVGNELLGVKGVLVGDADFGPTSTFLSRLRQMVENTPTTKRKKVGKLTIHKLTPEDPCAYLDGHSQVLLEGIIDSKQLPKVEGYKTGAGYKHPTAAFNQNHLFEYIYNDYHISDEMQV